MAVYQLRIPATPPSKNTYDRLHWSKQAEQKRLWAQYVAIAAQQAGLPRRQVAKVDLSATITFSRRRHRDAQNYAQTLWHFIPDALVAFGVVPDDTPDHVRFPADGLAVTLASDGTDETVVRVRTYPAKPT